MILYHGSNVEVREPAVIQSDRRLDFGAGFYLTSDLAQALRWAKLTAERKGEGVPVVSVYEIDDTALSSLKIKSFHVPDAKWLKYVVSNRKRTAKEETADIVTGPVANDQTSPTITMFLVGALSLSETIRRLRPQQLKDQYAFKTGKALSALKFKEVITK